ncbi:hypothetical protein [Chlorogloea sp. CCALA 695]|nr:hypothetical protein [Chlorogloea sp. CCALA 695]
MDTSSGINLATAKQLVLQAQASASRIDQIWYHTIKLYKRV